MNRTRKTRYSPQNALALMTLVQGGESVERATKQYDVSVNTYYAWRKRYENERIVTNMKAKTATQNPQVLHSESIVLRKGEFSVTLPANFNDNYLNDVKRLFSNL